MRLVPLVTTGKNEFYLKVTKNGGEGIMLKDVNAKNIPEGRPKAMYKCKRFEEVDAFATGGDPGETGKGWENLIGDIQFSAITETGKVWMVARCANITLEERIDATVCGLCGGVLAVQHANVDGKRVVQKTECTQCHVPNPRPALNPAWRGRVATIRGQEWTARVYRLKHATVERWRLSGEDAKTQGECTINLKDIQQRFADASRSYHEE